MPQQGDHARKIEAMLNIHPKLVDLSLRRIARLLQAMGNPQRHLPPIIHIAGTNGKGSATAFARAFLEAAGYSAHVHTSPHLVHWHERYRLGGTNGGAYVSDALLAETLAIVTRAAAGYDITVFEILTAAAFVLFSRFPADVLLLEVGLGGRFDATNIIEKPAAALIMPIAFDHEALLGNSISKIAAEKAGIIKSGCPVVLGRQQYPQAVAAVRHTARAKQAPLSLYGRDYRAESDNSPAKAAFWRFTNANTVMELPKPRLAGEFQISNAAAALQAVYAAGFAVPNAAAKAAMRRVAWPARLQHITRGRLMQHAPKGAELWLDGGHNPAAAEVLAATLPKLIGKRPFFMICGLLQNKNAAGYLQNFAALAPQIYTVPIISAPQAAKAPKALAAAGKALGLNAQPQPSVNAALAAVSEHAAAQAQAPFILICGSLYLAGEALAQNGTVPQ